MVFVQLLPSVLLHARNVILAIITSLSVVPAGTLIASDVPLATLALVDDRNAMAANAPGVASAIAQPSATACSQLVNRARSTRIGRGRAGRILALLDARFEPPLDVVDAARGAQRCGRDHHVIRAALVAFFVEVGTGAKCRVTGAGDLQREAGRQVGRAGRKRAVRILDLVGGPLDAGARRLVRARALHGDCMRGSGVGGERHRECGERAQDHQQEDRGHHGETANRRAHAFHGVFLRYTWEYSVTVSPPSVSCSVIAAAFALASTALVSKLQPLTSSSISVRVAVESGVIVVLDGWVACSA